MDLYESWVFYPAYFIPTIYLIVILLILILAMLVGRVWSKDAHK